MSRTGRATGLARFTGLRGWRRLAVAFAAGSVGALAMPPFGWLPTLVVALVPAVWLIDGATDDERRSARLVATALVGWAWGFGYLVAGLWWLGSAFLVEADEFLWALPLGVVGLPLVLGLFYGAGFALAGVLWSRGTARLAALAFGVATVEWLRGHVFTGFPWNTLGMALGQDLHLMQAAALVGLYGLTLAVVLIAAAPATLVTGRTLGARFAPTFGAVLALAGFYAFGIASIPDGAQPTLTGVRLRLVQPNLPQDAKFRPENRDDIVDRYIELSQRPPEGGGVPTHLVWPESAFPFLIQRDPATLARVGRSLVPGQRLLTGAARADEALPGERLRYYNAIMSIEAPGHIADTYDKVHLVPFGEYLPGPLDAVLRAVGLRQFIAIPGGFTPGDRTTQRILSVPGLPPAVGTICYEAMFPGALRPAGATEAPGLILNVTNDAWFGDTPGPRQHFAQARLRTVEEGLPLVRDANTGISAVIDPYGRIVAERPLGFEGILDADLPRALDGATPYVRFGDLPFAGLLALCGAAALAGRRREA